MNIQTSDLTVSDPLAEQEVTIVIRVLPDSTQRPARTALVSVGTAGQVPAFASGTLEEVAGLIRQTWFAYGVQFEARQSTPGTDAVVAETVAEAAVVDEASPNPLVQPPSAKAPPRPQNLSIF
jgi:hypothetical protein